MRYSAPLSGFICTLVILLSVLASAQNVGISADGLPPHPSATLDIRSGDGGVLIPRTDTQSIASPAHGLMIYDTLGQCFYYFKTDRWVKLLDESKMFFLFADRDGDGYGDKYSGIYTAVNIPGYVPDSTDCNDGDSTLFEVNPDICDGFDNDCDPATPDGYAEALFGMPCDGMDLDSCMEGTWICNGTMLICSDNTGDNLELCDGIDNDCNPLTLDGEDEPWFNMTCDGADAGVCEEGFYICSGGIQDCTDLTGDDLEICGNFIDDDCDGMAEEGCACANGEMVVVPCGPGGCDTQTLTCVDGMWDYTGDPCEC